MFRHDGTQKDAGTEEREFEGGDFQARSTEEGFSKHLGTARSAGWRRARRLWQRGQAHFGNDFRLPDQIFNLSCVEHKLELESFGEACRRLSAGAGTFTVAVAIGSGPGGWHHRSQAPPGRSDVTFKPDRLHFVGDGLHNQSGGGLRGSRRMLATIWGLSTIDWGSARTCSSTLY